MCFLACIPVPFSSFFLPLLLPPPWALALPPLPLPAHRSVWWASSPLSRVDLTRRGRRSRPGGDAPPLHLPPLQTLACLLRRPRPAAPPPLKLPRLGRAPPRLGCHTPLRQSRPMARMDDCCRCVCQLPPSRRLGLMLRRPCPITRAGTRAPAGTLVLSCSGAARAESASALHLRPSLVGKHQRKRLQAWTSEKLVAAAVVDGLTGWVGAEWERMSALRNDSQGGVDGRGLVEQGAWNGDRWRGGSAVGSVTEATWEWCNGVFFMGMPQCKRLTRWRMQGVAAAAVVERWSLLFGVKSGRTALLMVDTKGVGHGRRVVERKAWNGGRWCGGSTMGAVAAATWEWCSGVLSWGCCSANGQQDGQCRVLRRRWSWCRPGWKREVAAASVGEQGSGQRFEDLRGWHRCPWFCRYDWRQRGVPRQLLAPRALTAGACEGSHDTAGVVVARMVAWGGRLAGRSLNARRRERTDALRRNPTQAPRAGSGGAAGRGRLPVYAPVAVRLWDWRRATGGWSLRNCSLRRGRGRGGGQSQAAARPCTHWRPDDGGGCGAVRDDVDLPDVSGVAACAALVQFGGRPRGGAELDHFSPVPWGPGGRGVCGAYRDSPSPIGRVKVARAACRGGGGGGWADRGRPALRALPAEWWFLGL